MKKKIRIISRNSPLALVQVEEVMKTLPQHEYSLHSIESLGDKQKEVSMLEGNVATDFFTRELDEALLSRGYDISIHSAKDLPEPMPDGLQVIAITESLNKTDALVSRDNISLKDLPQGATIGTSSPSRKEQILKLRPDLKIVGIRGTIHQRIAYIEEGKADAVIVATCALERLGLQDYIAEELPIETHPMQGNLAITARVDNEEMANIFAKIDTRKTVLCNGTNATFYHHLGKVIHCPIIDLQKISDTKDISKKIQNSYDYIIFTSKFSVQYLLQILIDCEVDKNWITDKQIISIGRKTTKVLNDNGIKVDYTATDETSEGVVACFHEYQLAKGKVFLPVSEMASPTIPMELNKVGYDVDRTVVYTNIIPVGYTPIDLNDIDIVVFTSPSTVKNFVKVYGAIPTDKDIVSKGVHTSREIERQTRSR